MRASRSRKISCCRCALDGNPGNMRGDLGQPGLFRQRSAIFFAVHRKRTQHITLRRENRGRPTGAESANLCQLSIIGPERICHHVGHHHWSPPVHGGATRTVARSDRRTVYRLYISFRQIWRRAVTHMFAVAVQEKNGTTQSFRLAFHEKNKAGQNIRQRRIGGDHLEHAALPARGKILPL